MNETLHVEKVTPVIAPIQKKNMFLPELIAVTFLIRAGDARKTFNVDGAGATVAVLDTGLRTTHVDFAGRVVAGRNFTSDNGGNPDDPSDGNGHGTNVAGIVCAGKVHIGIAPGARVVPLKVLGNSGGGDFAQVRDALQWVLDSREKLGISAVCMSLGASDNLSSDDGLSNDGIGARLKALNDAGVVCCVAAGNDYFAHASTQGMSYPAIFRQTFSVGAVYDSDQGSFSYQSGASAFATAADRITPFSQRLHEKVGGECATDIFAPGAPVTSSGIASDSGSSIQHGTSQATPVIAGVVALLQSYHLRATGRLPAVADVRRWLLQGAVVINDGDDEQDNVLHTGLAFRRVDAMASLAACAKSLATKELIMAGSGLRPMQLAG
jgi:subtilisin family serine protease